MDSIQVSLANSTDKPSFDAPYIYDRAAPAIGEGAVGAVYKGQSANGKSVVIKTPTDAKGAAEISQEYEILGDIRRAAQPSGQASLFPEAVLGLQGQTQVLVMPMYKTRMVDKVRELLGNDNTLEAEKLAVAAAIDYCSALSLLHTARRQTCTDRKIEDFFFLDDQKLVIIDWNVLRDPTKDFFSAEIIKFGELWQVLVRNTIDTPPLQPFADRYWTSEFYPGSGGAISVGLRVILAHAVHYDETLRFVDEDGLSSQQVLRDTLSQWQNLLNGTEQLSLAKLPRALRLSEGEAEAIIADLKWRKQPNNARLEEDRNETLERLAASRDPKEVIIEALNRNDWEAARTTVQKGLESPTNSDLDKAHFTRWQLILDLAGRYKEAAGLNFKRLSDQSLRKKLSEVGQTLHEDPKRDSELTFIEIYKALDEVRLILTIDNSAEKLLEPLRKEVDIRNLAMEHRRIAKGYKDKHLLPNAQRLVAAIRALLEATDVVIPYMPNATSPLMISILDLAGIDKALAEAEQTFRQAQEVYIEQTVKSISGQQADRAVVESIERYRLDLEQKVTQFQEQIKTAEQQHEAKRLRFDTEIDAKIRTNQTAMQTIESQIDEVKQRISAYSQLDKQLSDHQTKILQAGQQVRTLHERLEFLEASHKEMLNFDNAELDIYHSFANGNIDYAASRVRELQQQYPAKQVQFQQRLLDWLTRLSEYEYLKNHLDSVEQWFKSVQADLKPRPETWHTLNRVIEDLYSAMQHCPADAFTEQLMRQWSDLLARIAEQAHAIATKAKRAIPQVPDPKYTYIQDAGRSKHNAFCQYFAVFFPGSDSFKGNRP